MADPPNKGKELRLEKSASTFARTVEKVQKQNEALGLKQKGYSYREVGERMGISQHTAAAYVADALKAIPSENLSALRRMEHERLQSINALLVECMQTEHPLVSNGRLFEGQQDWQPRLSAANLAIRLSESLRKLHGMDEPVRTKVEVVTDDQVNAEIAALTQQLRERGEIVPVLDGEVEDDAEWYEDTTTVGESDLEV